MGDSLETAKANKELILVLPHTFFHNAFRFYPNFTMDNLEELKYCRFIVNLVIELSSIIPENKYITTTSEKAFSEFEKKLNEGVPVIGADVLLAVFQNLVYLIKDTSINNLGDEESMIAIAHRLYSASNYEPVIIVNPDSKANFMKVARTFYNIDTSKTELPFKIYDVHEIKAFLEGKFPIESRIVRERTEIAFKIF